MKLYSIEIPHNDPCAVFAAFADEPYSLLLDSADRAHKDARYSFITIFPVEIIESKGEIVMITSATGQISFPDDPFDAVESRLNARDFAAAPLPGLPPFQGGAAGLFGYDLGRALETLPKKSEVNPRMPDMAIGIYDQVITFDHAQEKAWIITHAENEAKAEEKRQIILDAMRTHRRAPTATNPAVEWKANFTAEEYKAQVQRAVDYIRAGDIFQANIAQRFDAELPDNFDTFAHYGHLRAINSAPFAAYMNMGDIKISSASPERFLTIKDRHVTTKPIKGTKPRLNGAEDEKQKAALRASEKDLAENVMIVDLIRNDLSRVCAADSVQVEKLCDVESFKNVHHLVSTVSGKLQEDCTAFDALRACFPGGSITGAPKIRAMEIIEEIEPTQRGPYCGSIGYIGFDGATDMNILIRTLVYDSNAVSFQAGGGITASSVPEEEYQETLDKAAAIFRSFEPEQIRKAG